MKKSAAIVAALLGCLALTPGSAPAQTPKTIIFLAGPEEHGAPGRHEYERICANWPGRWNMPTNLKGLKTVVLVGKPPRDLSIFQDAAAIVIDGNGGWLRKETGMLFPQDQDTDGRSYDPETTAWLKSLDQLIKDKRIGLAVFHYTMWIDNWAENAICWIGWAGSGFPIPRTIPSIPGRSRRCRGATLSLTASSPGPTATRCIHAISCSAIHAGPNCCKPRRPVRRMAAPTPIAWAYDRAGRWPLLRVGRVRLPRQYAQRDGLPPLPAQRHSLDRRSGRAARERHGAATA